MRYAVSKLEPTTLTWAGIFNMLWVAGLTLRRDGAGPNMTVKFSRRRGDKLIRLEATAEEIQPCELCYMNPPCDMTEGGGVTFLPVPEALPDDTLCADCRQQCDEWDESAKRHREENHQAPWKHNCEMCSMAAYTEDGERAWHAHLAKCSKCQTSPHDFVGTPPCCRECGAEASKVPSDEVCTASYTREMHRDNC